jgi:hypothetical protein
MKIRLGFIFLFLVSKNVCSQSPGGVGTANLRGWFDATTGVTLTTGAVSAWQDRAGVGNATQGTANQRPTVATSTINYNDALRFDGANDNLTLIDRMATGAAGVSAFAVARQIATSADSWGSIFNGQANGPLWTGGGYGLVSLNAGSTQQGFYIRDYNTRGVSFAVTNGVPYLISGNWNGATANAIQAFRNGVSAGTVAYTPGSVGDNGSSWIGSGDGTNGDWCYFGDIAEVAVFNTGLSVANNNQVISYLALKYGITLGTNYVNSAGTTVYTTTGSYTNAIIGISRDDGSGLIQRQSRTSDDSLRIYISTLAASNSANTGVFASNLSHVVVGANAGNMCSAFSSSTEIPAGFGIVKRLDREWKVTNTNFNGTFSMDFRLNACAAPASVSIADLRLLIDDDGNFAAGTNSSIASGGGITFSYSNPVITVSGISTALIPSGATRFITIGSVNVATAPLPIELLNFSAVPHSNSIDLNWSTLSEKNNNVFEIEKSADAIVFEKIHSTYSKALNGNSSQKLDYSYTDTAPERGVNYYRLKQIDKNFEFTFSKLITVDFFEKKNISVILYPNPNSGEFTIDFSGMEEKNAVSVTMCNEHGAIVYDSFFNISKDSQSIKILPKNKLNSSVYICTMKIEKEEIKLKVLIEN